MKKSRYGLLVIFFTLLVTHTVAQKTKTQLQQERQKNLIQIQKTERILQQTKREKTHSIGELTALQARLKQQKTLIQSIQDETALLDADIRDNQEKIRSMKHDLDKLKEEYAAMLFAAQKASGQANRLAFLFSSRTFDQLIMRLKYMEQYSQARKNQAQAIQRGQRRLKVQTTLLQQRRAELTHLLSIQKRENEKLNQLQTHQRQVISGLELQEEKLRKELQETRQAVAKLDILIDKIIRAEIERQKREDMARRQKEQRDKTKTSTLSPEDISLSNQFVRNKKKLAWPVNGFISQHFGKQPHPILSGIIIQNDGINLQTNQNEPVRVIFDGQVRAVSQIPILGQAVVVKHGEYYTIYSCLKDVSVKKGDQLKRNQTIAKVLTNPQGVTELRLMVWKNVTKLNPEQWLKP